MSTKPVKFSEHFEIDKEKLKELGVFDPILQTVKNKPKFLVIAPYQVYIH